MNDITPAGRKPLPPPGQKSTFGGLTNSKFPAIDLPPISPKPAINRTKKLLTLLGVFFLLSIILTSVSSFAGYLWYRQQLKAPSTTYQPIAVEIPAGASLNQVASNLSQANVVKNAFAVEIYMRLSGNNNIKAGHYLLSPSQNVEEIVSWLVAGRVNTVKITILPGKTIKELKQSLLEYYSETEIDAALAQTYSGDLFADKPSGTSLEGYIYPDTYFVNANDSVEVLFKKSFDEFERRIVENNLSQKLAERGFNIYQSATLASLIYGEVPDYEDRRKVAQVFEKRLNLDMPLGSDVSFKYAAKQLGVASDPQIDSPYNTRIHPGLPPGPVSNFDISAMLALASPTQTDYLFFVSGDDGITRFSYTVEEHEQNVQSYCIELCRL